MAKHEPLARVIAGAKDHYMREDIPEDGLLNPQDGNTEAHLVSQNREHVLTQQRRGHPSIRAVRRRKAGPWVPVPAPSEGENEPKREEGI